MHRPPRRSDSSDEMATMVQCNGASSRPSAANPVQKTIQEIIHCSRLTVHSVDDLRGHLHRLCTIRLSNGSRLVLKTTPRPATAVLQHERQSLRTEAIICSLLARSSLPTPRVLKYEHGGQQLGSPYLLMTRLPGIPLRDLLSSLTRSERSSIDARLRSLRSAIGQHTSSSFGPAGLVASKKGFKTWREAFVSMQESIMLDGEDMMVNLPYFQIREAVSRWDAYLHDVKEARLVVLGLDRPENVLIDRKANEVTGLLDFGRAIWGDPGMTDCEKCGRIKGLL